MFGSLQISWDIVNSDGKAIMNFGEWIIHDDDSAYDYARHVMGSWKEAFGDDCTGEEI